MTDTLNLFGVDILSTIASHLPQRDVISWSLSSKKFKGVHPKDIVHTFAEEAGDEDYLAFIEYVAKRNIETLKVYVNPYIWNRLAHRLGGQRFKKVTIVPNNPRMYDYIYDNTSWIPECDELVLGFVSISDRNRIHISWRVGKLQLWTDQTSQPTMPYVDPKTGVDMVLCSGKFAGYDRLRDVSKIYVSRTYISPDMLSHLSRCRYVGIDSCVMEAQEAVPFEAEVISVGLDALPFIYDAPNCTEIVINTNGPLSDASRYMQRSFHKGMYANVKKVYINGYLYETEFDQLSMFIRSIFPSHTIFHFHVRLVNA
jgi:hypothetical protein